MRLSVFVLTSFVVLSACSVDPKEEGGEKLSALSLDTDEPCGISLATVGSYEMSLSENGTGNCSVSLSDSLNRASHLHLLDAGDDFVSVEFVFLDIPSREEIRVGQDFSGLAIVSVPGAYYQTSDSACRFEIEEVRNLPDSSKIEYRVSGSCSGAATDIWNFEGATPKSMTIKPFEFRTFDGYL